MCEDTTPIPPASGKRMGPRSARLTAMDTKTSFTDPGQALEPEVELQGHRHVLATVHTAGGDPLSLRAGQEKAW